MLTSKNMKTRSLLIVTLVIFGLLLFTNVIITAFKPDFNSLKSVHIVRVQPPYDEYVLVDEFREDSREEDIELIHPQKKIERGTNDEWHMITSDLLVYSAHADERLEDSKHGHFIKVIGLGPMNGTLPNITCILHYGSMLRKSPLEVYYKIETLIPWEGQTLDSYVFMCRLDDKTIPAAVSFRRENPRVTTAALTIRHPRHSSYLHRFSVCVEPLTRKYDDINSLKHFITVNSYFGADHFYFYNLSTSQKVNNLLHKLENTGLVTVFQWKLGKTEYKTHSSAQKAMNNHCILHNIYLSRYVALIDIDEVLMPQPQAKELITIPSWNDIASHCIDDNQNNGAYVIQSQLFPHGAEMIKHLRIPNHFWSLGVFQSTEPYPLYQWSKVLVDTERIDIMDIHKVNQMLPMYSICNVPPEVATIYHYRLSETPNSYTTQLNDYMRQYENQLLSKYHELFDE